MIIQMDPSLSREHAVNRIANMLRRKGVTLWLDWDLTSYSNLMTAANYVYDLMLTIEAANPQSGDYNTLPRYRQVA